MGQGPGVTGGEQTCKQYGMEQTGLGVGLGLAATG